VAVAEVAELQEAANGQNARSVMAKVCNMQMLELINCTVLCFMCM